MTDFYQLISRIDPRAGIPRGFGFWSRKLQTAWLKQHQKKKESKMQDKTKRERETMYTRSLKETKLVIRAAKKFLTASDHLVHAANHRAGFQAGSRGLARANAAYAKRVAAYDTTRAALLDVIKELG